MSPPEAARRPAQTVTGTTRYLVTLRHGGAPVKICAVESGRGGSWAEDGTIVFSQRTEYDLHPDGTRVAMGLVDPDVLEGARFARDTIVFWSGFADYLRKNVVVKK